MEKSQETLRHLMQFKNLIEENIHVESMFREHLKKKNPANLDELLVQSKSYQVFLERMLSDVFEDITL